MGKIALLGGLTQTCSFAVPMQSALLASLSGPHSQT